MSSPYVPRHNYGTRRNSIAHANLTPAPTGTCLYCQDTGHVTEHCPHLQRHIPKPEKIRTPRKCGSPTRPSKKPGVKSKHPQKTENTNNHLCTPQFEKPSNSPPPYFSTPYPFDAYVRESLSDDTLFDGPDFYTAESMFTTSQGCTNNIDPNYEQMGNFIDASLPNPFYELQGIAPPKRSGGRRTGIQSSHEDVVWQTATTALSQNNVAETSHYDEATWSDYLH